MAVYKIEDQDCVYVVRDCNDPDIPVVTEDCGINDLVVRRWAQSSYRNLADPVSTPRQRPSLVAMCEE